MEQKYIPGSAPSTQNTISDHQNEKPNIIGVKIITKKIKWRTQCKPSKNKEIFEPRKLLVQLNKKHQNEKPNFKSSKF